MPKVYPKVCDYGGCEAPMDEEACPYNIGYCIDHCYCPEHFDEASNYPMSMK
jgi:hypothetical protein